MYVIGLTGGVGSGKTVVAHGLAEITGAQVLLADELGHLIMEKGEKGYQEIVQAFGEEILDEQGKISREALAGIVFAEEEKLQKLNQIIHPAVKAYIRDYIEERREEEGFLVLETAIMFETGCDMLCDEVWYVYVPEEIRMARLAKNRGYSREKSQSIMKQQLLEREFRRRCKRTVCNDGNLEMLGQNLRRLLSDEFGMKIF